MKLAGCALVLAGCAAFQSAAPSLLPTPKQVECVVSEVENGQADPLAVALKCGFEANAVDFVAHLIEGATAAKSKRPAGACR